MAKIDYQNSSPYADTQQTSWFLSNMTYRDIPRDGTDTLKVLESRYNNRPDLLSYDLYGTPNYWWVFMIVNPDRIKDPIYDFKTGTVVFCPTASRLTQILGG
jgi:hypothetical protein